MPIRWPFVRKATLQAQGDTILEQLGRHIAAAYQGAGEIDLNSLTGTSSRDRSIVYTALTRAVTLTTSVCARMITNGDLHVRNRDDKLVTTRRVRRTLDMLCSSPDNGATSSHQFFEDLIADYCLDGNGLLTADMGIYGEALGLKRYNSFDAFSTHMVGGPPIYHMTEVEVGNGQRREIEARKVMHVRWPKLHRGWIGHHQRERFSLPTTTLLGTALGIGIEQERYIRWWFKEAPKAGVHFDVAFTNDKQAFLPEQLEKIRAKVVKRLAAGEVVYTQGTSSRRIEATAQDNEVKELREFQVQEIARFFGYPLPLVSMPLGQWTRGVNEQVMQMAWRTGFRTHLDRLLSVLSLGMLPMGERFEPDSTAFVRGDAASIAELVMALQGDAQRDPVASRSELRHMSGLPNEPPQPIVPTKKEISNEVGSVITHS